MQFILFINDVLQLLTFYLNYSYPGLIRKGYLPVNYRHSFIYIITDQQVAIQISPVNQW